MRQPRWNVNEKCHDLKHALILSASLNVQLISPSQLAWVRLHHARGTSTAHWIYHRPRKSPTEKISVSQKRNQKATRIDQSQHDSR